MCIQTYLLYRQALGKDDWLDEPPTQEEEDLWDQSLLNVSSNHDSATNYFKQLCVSVFSLGMCVATV